MQNYLVLVLQGLRVRVNDWSALFLSQVRGLGGKLGDLITEKLGVVTMAELAQVLHCTALHCTVLYCTVLYCTVLYCTALHCTALHCIV